jgi:thioredoxin reductase/NAD-dependent dihydropyrimidine dehydrogenase PreA subunit
VSLESAIVWVVAVAIVIAVVVPYVLRFRRRTERDRERKQEAARLGIDRPAAQFPYVDSLDCVGCGACVEACPEGDVLGVVGGTAVVINGLRRVGHGLCEDACPVTAIEAGLGDLKSRVDVPLLTDDLETSVEGLLVAGELGGLSLVRNAVSQGRRAAEYARERTERGDRPHTPDVVDLAIVGAGPAGVSAALTAASAGLSYVIFEREPDLGGSLLHYPRRKMVLTQPVELRPWGALDREEYLKEDLLEIFESIVSAHGLNVRFGEPVEDLTRAGDHFRLRSPRGTLDARHIVLAQGRRGLPRKLGVPGEERAKVMYRLIDAASYRDRDILVVGGGDSAIEAAVGLGREGGNRVTLSYRREKLVRIKKKNQDAVDDAFARGRIQARLGSEVVEIGDRRVVLRLMDGSTVEIDNDYVFIFAGGVPPFDLLKKAGARFGGEGE